MISPHTDWRTVANYSKDKPRCANCGKPFGNAYFGAAHATNEMSKYVECPGYEPEETA